MMKVIKAEDPITISNITMLILGRTGAGKTSFASSARKPIIFAADEKVYRAKNRGDSQIVKTFLDLLNINKADVQEYDTLVYDTIGNVVSLSGEYVKELHPTYRSAIGLTLAGWGAARTANLELFKMHSGWGKDLIFIAHEKEDKRGEEIIIRPDVAGSTIQYVQEVADAIGYIYRTEDGRRAITFNSTSVLNLKNPYDAFGDSPIIIPDYSDVPDFAAQLIKKLKDTLNKKSTENIESAAKLAKLFEEIEGMRSIDNFNLFYEKRDKLDLNTAEKKQLREKIITQAAEHGFKFDNGIKKFVIELQDGITLH